HDRFYSAWIQPTTNVPSGTKISTLVNVRIEKDGRVSKFEIAKRSGNATVNESVAAVAKQISHVDPPPTGLIKGDHYDVKINFELNTKKQKKIIPPLRCCAAGQRLIDTTIDDHYNPIGCLASKPRGGR